MFSLACSPGSYYAQVFIRIAKQPQRDVKLLAPKNIGYLISAVKLSQAEFNMKSKVAKLEDFQSVWLSIKLDVHFCVRPEMALLLIRSADRKQTFRRSQFWLIDYSNGMSHVHVACPPVLCLSYPEGQTYLHAFSLSDLSLSICRLCLHLLWDLFQCMISHFQSLFTGGLTGRKSKNWSNNSKKIQEIIIISLARY